MNVYPRNGVCRLRGLCMAVALCFVLALSIPAAEDVKVVEAGEEAEVVETAATVQLTRTEGTVTVTNAVGRAVSRLTKLRLYSGYHLNTDQKSYAWVALDDERLAKIDAASALEIRKKGKALELLLESGSVYFNIAKPLEEDESLNICTSSMIIGIRGTSGWVDVVDQNNSVINILEGTVSCTVADPVSGEVDSISVSGGESVTASIAPEGGIQELTVQPVDIEAVSGFVLKELVENAELCQEIFEKSGLDFRDVTAEEADRRQAQDEAKDAAAYEEMLKELAMQSGAANGSSSSDSDDSGTPPASDRLTSDGYFTEWTNVPHFNIGYDGPESGVESKSALCLRDGNLYGHVVISHPGTGKNLSGRFLEDIRISFNGDPESGMEDGIFLYPVMYGEDGVVGGMNAPAPDGGKTYYIYDRRDASAGASLGTARSFVAVGREEMEFEINLTKAADRMGVNRDSLWMFAIQYGNLSMEWASVSGAPTGAGFGLALCLSSVGAGYAWKRKKKPEHRKNK